MYVLPSHSIAAQSNERPRWPMFDRVSVFSSFVGVLLAAVLAWVPATGWSASVRAVQLSEMLTAAELVFEGQVIGQQVRRGASKRDIHTEVSFQVLDVIKGAWPDDTIVLSFAGGTVDGRTVAVSDLRRPSIGDHGVFFVESLSRRQVHPLYGWDQGRFRVVTDVHSGQTFVETYDGQHVYGATVSRAQAAHAAGLSNGVALGLRLQRRSTEEMPMTLEQFKQTLRRPAESGGLQ